MQSFDINNLPIAPSWLNAEAVQTLEKGYLMPGETPRDMWMRCANAAEKYLGIKGISEDFMEMFWKGYMGGASPVLSNFGTSRGLPISCLETGTRIHTPDGFKEIQNLVPGDLVLTHMGNWKPVVNVWSRETKGDLYKLSVSSRGEYSLNITGNHPVLTNKGWVKVEELDPSTHSICTEPLNTEGEGSPMTFTLEKQDRETTVWDIEVADDHSFLAQGVVVHNCYSSHISDNITSIYSHLKEVAALSKNGGGVGVYFGDLRPSGSPITGGGKSTGVVPWMRQYDMAASVVSQGSTRRGSFALYLPIDHPDLMEALRTKDHSQGDPRQFIDSNLAVTITDQWVEGLMAGDIDKKRVFAEVLRSRLVSGSPYIIYIDNANNSRPACFKQRNLQISTSNLCFTGDTRVAVADGRNSVAISELCDTGTFPVYSAKRSVHGKWSTRINKATAFKTGTREVVEVLLEDGSKFRCTPDHELATKDTKWVKAIDSVGVVLEPLTQFKNQYGHYMMNTVSDGHKRQAKMIWEHYNNKSSKGFQVDHIESGLNDSISNLQLLTVEQHRAKTSAERKGSNNPIHKIDKRFHSEYISASVSGEKNPRHSKFSNQELIDLGKAVYAEKGSFKKSDYLGLIKMGYKVPRSFSKYRFGGMFSIYSSYVKGEKEYKGEWEVFKVPPVNPNKEKNKQLEAKVKSIRSSGLRVISVTPVGTEDVYDLTVENDHNFYIYTTESEDFRSGVLVHNCSEIFLPTDENHTFVCVLSSLNLAKYDEWRTWVGPRTGKTVPELGMYFLDAVVEDFIHKGERINSMGRAVRFAKKSRALGLGTMGLHALYQSRFLPFESEGARQLNIEVHGWIDDMTLKASQQMAKEYGEPEWCKDNGVRNATRIAIAPTKTNSVICGAVSEGVEPLTANLFVAENAKGTFVRRNPYLEAYLNQIGQNTQQVWDSILEYRGSVQHLNFLPKYAKNVFKTAREIDQFEIIRQGSDRQHHVCQGQSINLYVEPDCSAEYLYKLHLSAWAMKLKSLYYLKSTSLQVKAKPSPKAKPKARIITKPDCPYCVKAKDFLNQHGYDIEEIDRSDVPDSEWRWETVPQIWIDGTHVPGGYTGLVAEPSYAECEACQG